MVSRSGSSAGAEPAGSDDAGSEVGGSVDAAIEPTAAKPVRAQTAAPMATRVRVLGWFISISWFR